MRQKEEHHSLQTIYARVNTKYFDGKVNLTISWFGERDFRHRSSVRLGVYHLHKQTIKIHRILDHPHVPEYFVAYVIYHEMLHHVLPPIVDKKGRRSVHHQRFLKRERQFEEYALAREFADAFKQQHFIEPQLVRRCAVQTRFWDKLSHFLKLFSFSK